MLNNSLLVRDEHLQVGAETRPPRHRQGVGVWFTGLGGRDEPSVRDPGAG